MILLGIWFILQFLPAVGQTAITDVGDGGGVAYFAHVGGFVFGLLTIKLFADRHRRRETSTPYLSWLARGSRHSHRGAHVGLVFWAFFALITVTVIDRGGHRHPLDQRDRDPRPARAAAVQLPARRLEVGATVSRTGLGSTSDKQDGSAVRASGRFTASSRALRLDPGLELRIRGSGGDRHRRGENLEVEPPRRLVQSFTALWSDEVKSEGVSRVTWEIEPRRDSCQLRVTHDQLREGANSELFGGWMMILSGLKTLLETGEQLDTPGSLRYSGVSEATA